MWKIVSHRTHTAAFIHWIPPQSRVIASWRTLQRLVTEQLICFTSTTLDCSCWWTRSNTARNRKPDKLTDPLYLISNTENGTGCAFCLCGKHIDCKQVVPTLKLKYLFTNLGINFKPKGFEIYIVLTTLHWYSWEFFFLF